MQVEMLEKEYSYFKQMRDRLVLEHHDEFVVIKNEQILGFFKTDIEALKETLKIHEAGTFIVQKCIPEDEEVQKYHSRVIFA